MDWNIAHRLRQSQAWKLHLTHSEGQIFYLATVSRESWISFLSDPTAFLSNSKTDTDIDNNDGLMDNNHIGDNEMPFAYLIAAKIRCMVTEQKLDNLYSLQDHQVAMDLPQNDLHDRKGSFTLIEDLDNHQGITHLNVDVEMDNTEIDDRKGKNTLILDLYNEIYIPIDDVYHLLHHDAELYDNIHLIELKNEIQEQTHSDVKKQQPQKEADSQQQISGLKYMLQIISEKADMNQLKEIKKMLIEARPSKSKWANEERVGQEQLYEPLDKVLNSLKNYTDHSLPFLKPVQKRDAPAYYQVIKNPMDLGTVF